MPVACCYSASLSLSGQQVITLSQATPWSNKADFAPHMLVVKAHDGIINSVDWAFQRGTWLHYCLSCQVRPHLGACWLWRPTAQLSNLVLLRMDSDVLLMSKIKALDLSSLAHLKLLDVDSAHLQHLLLPASLQVLLWQNNWHLR